MWQIDYAKHVHAFMHKHTYANWIYMKHKLHQISIPDTGMIKAALVRIQCRGRPQTFVWRPINSIVLWLLLFFGCLYIINDGTLFSSRFNVRNMFCFDSVQPSMLLLWYGCYRWNCHLSLFVFWFWFVIFSHLCLLLEYRNAILWVGVCLRALGTTWGKNFLSFPSYESLISKLDLVPFSLFSIIIV